MSALLWSTGLVTRMDVLLLLRTRLINSSRSKSSQTRRIFHYSQSHCDVTVLEKHQESRRNKPSRFLYEVRLITQTQLFREQPFVICVRLVFILATKIVPTNWVHSKIHRTNYHYSAPNKEFSLAISLVFFHFFKTYKHNLDVA